MAYTKRYALGFNDSGPSGGTGADSQFLNNVEAALLALLGVDATADGQALLWKAANSRYEPALINNANIDPAAAIARSKLGALNIADADIAGAANIAASKLAAGIPLNKLSGYPGDSAQVPKGDGTWGKIVAVGNKISDLPAGSDGASARLRVLPATYNNGGATALPTGTLTVGDTTGFAASGTLVTPNGSVTYTGKTNTTFTGCAGGSGTLAAGAVISQDPTTTGADSEYVNLVYDAYQSKWVSPQIVVPWIAQIATAMTATANTWVAAGMAPADNGRNAIPVTTRWRWYDNAGLQPQCRINAAVTNSTAPAPANPQIRVHWWSADIKDSVDAFTNIGADTNSASNIGTASAQSPAAHAAPSCTTPWAVLPAYTLKDTLYVSVDFFCTVVGGSVPVLDHPYMFVRWVG